MTTNTLLVDLSLWPRPTNTPLDLSSYDTTSPIVCDCILYHIMISMFYHLRIIINETFSVEVCYYKGNSYKTGQTWQDGCDYNCICNDANTGKYTCTDK